MAMFNPEEIQQISKILGEMENPIKIIFFKGDNEKSHESEQFVTEFESFSSKLSVEIYDFHKDLEKVKEWNVIAAPVIFITNKEESLKGVGFYGTPGGYEVNSFIMSLLEVSGKVSSLSPEQMEKIKQIKDLKKVYIFASLTCPQCPHAVMAAHKLALFTSNMTAMMIEGPAFPELSEKYHISALPTIIVEGKEQQLVGDNAKNIDKLIEFLI